MSTESRYPVNLAPISNSHSDDDVEAQLYQIFTDLFENYIRSSERDLNVHSMPHLGSFDLVSRFVEVDGLALINNDDEPAMRYLHKAWVANNPKRGTHFLKTYLQLLFPDGWKVEQLWHSANDTENYPATSNLKRRIPDSPFLTSRLRVGVYNAINDKSYIDRIKPAIRSILPSRLLLDMHPYVPTESKLSVADLASIRGTGKWPVITSPVNPTGSISRFGTANLLDVKHVIKKVSGASMIDIDPLKSSLAFANHSNIRHSVVEEVNPNPVKPSVPAAMAGIGCIARIGLVFNSVQKVNIQFPKIQTTCPQGLPVKAKVSEDKISWSEFTATGEISSI